MKFNDRFKINFGIANIGSCGIIMEVFLEKNVHINIIRILCIIASVLSEIT